MKRAVFLDRDGVLNAPSVRDGRPHPPVSAEEFSIYPEAPAACDALKSAGYLLVVATNQPDVGRGTQRREEVERMHRLLCDALPIDRVEVCYDPREEGSSCYKPSPGMLVRAAGELEVDLRQSYMVGDRWRDVDCGAAAGCRTIFIDRGYRESLRAQPDFVVFNVLEAARVILSNPVGEPDSCKA